MSPQGALLKLVLSEEDGLADSNNIDDNNNTNNGRINGIVSAAGALQKAPDVPWAPGEPPGRHNAGSIKMESPAHTSVRGHDRFSPGGGRLGIHKRQGRAWLQPDKYRSPQQIQGPRDG